MTPSSWSTCMPVAVAGDQGKAGAGVSEGVQRSGVGGRLDDDHVARVDEHPRQHVHDLLGARGDHDLLGPDGASQRRGHALDQLVHERAIAFRGAVLQGDLAELAKGLGARGELLHGEDLGVRQPSREGDHPGLLDELEELANGGRSHRLRRPGVSVLECHRPPRAAEFTPTRASSSRFSAPPSSPRPQGSDSPDLDLDWTWTWT